MSNNISVQKTIPGSLSSRPERRCVRERIYHVVCAVSCGEVATYGQVARIVGCSPREVGYAMAALMPASGVPWQRVINRYGRISLRSDGQPDAEQRRQLQEEGIVFDDRDVIDLSVYGWQGPTWEWLANFDSDVLPLA